jgi:hypothetical protein
VGRNAYKLKLPITWKMWPVISVVYLDPAVKGQDPFTREQIPPPPIVRNADDPDAEWEVEAVIKKRISRTTRKRKSKTEYLIRFKGFGPEFDEWKDEDEMDNCADLVQEYEHSSGNTSWEPPVSWNVVNERILGVAQTVESGSNEPKSENTTENS